MARQHDETYKLIFSHLGAVEDLVRSFVGKDMAEEFDFDTLEALPTDRISEELVRRRLDLLWKIRFRRKWLYVLIHIEFQSEVDPFMALRVVHPSRKPPRARPPSTPDHRRALGEDPLEPLDFNPATRPPSTAAKPTVHQGDRNPPESAIGLAEQAIGIRGMRSTDALTSESTRKVVNRVNSAFHNGNRG